MSIAFRNLSTLIVLGVIISLFGNLLLSIFSAPGSLITAIFVSRDLLILLPILISLSLLKFNIINQITILWLLIAIVFSISLVFLNDILASAFIWKSRSLFALPFIILLFRWPCLISPRKVILIMKTFIVLCFIEAVFKITGLGAFYHDLINLNQYLDAKGTQVGFGYGLFGMTRLLSPMFQPSLGGVIIGAGAILFWRERMYLWATTSLVLLTMTVSKTGLLIVISSVFGLIPLPISYFGLLFLPYAMAQTLGSYDLPHISSILYHFAGYFEGYKHFFEPMGVGLTGTVVSIEGRQVGAESGLGTLLAAYGIYGIPILIIAMLSSKNQFMWLFLISFIFTEITLNLYVGAIFAFISNGLSKERNDFKLSYQ